MYTDTGLHVYTQIAEREVACAEITDPLPDLARAAKVNDANSTPLGVAEQDVLWFEVAVDDVKGGVGEEQQRRA